MTKTVKSYTEEGTKYQFDCKKLQMYTNQMKRDLRREGTKKNQTHIKEELAEKIFVSAETVNSWMYGSNGPSDLEQVKQIADYFGVEYHQLLKKEGEEEMTTVNGFTGMASEVQAQYTKDRVREIYGALLDCIYTALNFYDTQKADYESEQTGVEYEVSNRTNYSDADNACGKVLNLINRNLLDIPEDLYNQVKTYVLTDISNVIDWAFAYIIDEEDPEPDIEEEQEHAKDEIKAFRMRYVNDLRRIFADFIVK